MDRFAGRLPAEVAAKPVHPLRILQVFVEFAQFFQLWSCKARPSAEDTARTAVRARWYAACFAAKPVHPLRILQGSRSLVAFRTLPKSCKARPSAEDTARAKVMSSEWDMI